MCPFFPNATSSPSLKARRSTRSSAYLDPLCGAVLSFLPASILALILVRRYMDHPVVYSMHDIAEALNCVDCTTDSEGVPSLADPEENETMPSLESVTDTNSDSDEVLSDSDEEQKLETVLEEDEDEDIIPGLA